MRIKTAGSRRIEKKEIVLWIPVLIGLLILTVASGNCLGAKQDKQDKKNVIAKWGTKTLTQQDLEMRLKSLPAEAKGQFDSPEQKKRLLETLVQLQMVAAEAKTQKLDKKPDVATMIEDMTDSALYQTYLKQLLNKVQKPTDGDIENYFKAHASEFVVPKQVKAQHILLMFKPDAKPEDNAAVEAKAEGVYKEITEGGDFSKLAMQYSDDTETKGNGGDLGFFSKDQMIPAFSDVAFALKKDEVSRPIKTEYGVHIIKLNDVTPEKKLDLKEASASILAKIEEQRRKEVVTKELERLKKKYNVQIMDVK